jgi:hypothetical protein
LDSGGDRSSAPVAKVFCRARTEARARTPRPQDSVGFDKQRAEVWGNSVSTIANGAAHRGDRRARHTGESRQGRPVEDTTGMGDCLSREAEISATLDDTEITPKCLLLSGAGASPTLFLRLHVDAAGYDPVHHAHPRSHPHPARAVVEVVVVGAVVVEVIVIIATAVMVVVHGAGPCWGGHGGASGGGGRPSCDRGTTAPKALARSSHRAPASAPEFLT